MKKRFLAIVSVIALALALAAAPAVFAADNEAEAPPVLQPLPYYTGITGTVQEINPWYNTDGSESETLIVLVEDNNGELVNFVVDEDTYMLTENELKIGARVSGYYLSNLPVILIYPSRYHAALLAVDVPPMQSLKVALFDDNLISDDNYLKLHIGEDTEILLQNGEQAPQGLELAGRKLAVFYGISTFSIPAQTTPERIIVLDETEDTASTPPMEEDPLLISEFAVDCMPLAVENVLLLDAPPVYVREDGTVMAPLCAVAEALGYEVVWQNGVVTLDGQSMATIGQDGAELTNGHIYVPLSFFREVLKVNNAYVFEKQVEINNGEKME